MISGYLLEHGTQNKGLGNQMFRMAAVCATAWNNNDLPAFKYTSEQELYIDNIFKKAPFYRVVYDFINGTPVDLDGMPSEWPHGPTYEESFTYTPITYHHQMYLKGYFQSPKYWKNQEDRIRDLFYPSTFDQTRLTVGIDSFDKHRGRIGALHVRRADYLVSREEHTQLTMNYYNESMNYLANEVDHWIICSDDIEWCKENFGHMTNVTFSTNTGDSPDDMWLMALCDHFIIANSTYSWWSAWLCKNPNKIVIYPVEWFGPALRDTHSINDLIPEGWVGIKETTWKKKD